MVVGATAVVVGTTAVVVGVVVIGAARVVACGVVVIGAMAAIVDAVGFVATAVLVDAVTAGVASVVITVVGDAVIAALVVSCGTVVGTDCAPASSVRTVVAGTLIGRAEVVHPLDPVAIERIAAMTTRAQPNVIMMANRLVRARDDVDAEFMGTTIDHRRLVLWSFGTELSTSPRGECNRLT